MALALTLPDNIDRVVLMFASVMIAVGTLLGMFVHAGCFAITFFVAANMFQASITSSCLLAYVLRRYFAVAPGAAFYGCTSSASLMMTSSSSSKAPPASTSAASNV